jgi:hypothetical protein
LVETYTFRPDELRILEDACREADLIDGLAAEAMGTASIVRGSQNQPVINPLISELRQHRATLASLLGKLKLPDIAEGSTRVGVGVRSVQAREAAQVRWGKR